MSYYHGGARRGGYSNDRSGGYGSNSFSISDVDFQRDGMLKRRWELPSPSRRAGATSWSTAASNSAAVAAGSSLPAEVPIAFRARSKSKSRARTMARKSAGQEFIPLGSNRTSSATTQNTNKASYYRAPVPEPTPACASSHWSSAARTTSRSNDQRGPSPISTRTRSKSVTRETRDTAAALCRSQRERQRSKSAARRSGGAPLTPRRSPSRGRRRESPGASRASTASGKKRTRSKSMSLPRERVPERGRQRERERSASRGRRRRSRATSSSSESDSSEEEKPALKRASRTRGSSKSGNSLEQIEAEMAAKERELVPRKKKVETLRGQLKELTQQLNDAELEVYDLEVDLDALRKRRDRRLPARSSREAEQQAAKSTSRRSRSKSTSKEQRRERKRSASRLRPSKRPRIMDEEDEDDDVTVLDQAQVKQELAATASRSAVVPIEDSTPDHFWGRSDQPKLLVNHRFRSIPDGSARKGRHLSFNPIQPSIFATSADEGGLILWSYQRQEQEISKVVSLVPESFRRDSPCAESISWSPDGNRLAMAFRDPLQGKGEFCIVQLHQLSLEDSEKPQAIPRERLTTKSTTLHSRGISAIDWLPTGHGAETTSRQLVTAGADHAVVMWEEVEDLRNGGMDLKWHVLHRDHKSEVRSICVHSKREALFTSGLDGRVIQYDLNRSHGHTVIERRKPSISKINSVLEHPHNPNVLLVSCVDQSRHNILLHDLRQRYSEREMTLTWDATSMSQYVVPRWSPAGYHVSCGSKSGVVNIWDVRVGGSTFPKVKPQQSLNLHKKTVLHSTWHPRYDAMFTVSFDRTIGLLTFR